MVRVDTLFECLGWIFFFAHASNYVQWRGLFGEDGLEPVSSWVWKAEPNPTLSELWAGKRQRFLLLRQVMDVTGVKEPTLICESCCLIGMTVALLVSCGGKRFQHSASFLVLWASYLTCYQAGRTFLSFQWDILLLEAGFLAIFASNRDISSLGTFGFRFLLFKLMFMSGVVKVQSRCPTWLGLTALDYHYATQCLPTPFAWYAHQLPGWVQRMSVFATLLFEIPFTFWILSPFRIHRQAAFAMQVLLQVLIIATGNYNFFNFLTITLCLSLLVERDASGAGEESNNNKHDGIIVWPRKLLQDIDSSALASTGLLVGAAAFTWQYVDTFMCDWVLSDTQDESFPVALKPTFADHLDQHVHQVIQPLWVFLLGHAILSAFVDVGSLLVQVRNCRVVQALCLSIRSLWAMVCCVALFATFLASFVTFASLDRQGEVQQVVPKDAFRLYFTAESFGGVTSAYGLFRRMTGVDQVHGTVARPEVILQFKTSPSEEWQDVEFMFKPGIVRRAPQFVWPYQPRLDWQMWFAALSTYQQAPWIIHLCDKLLRNAPHVVSLVRGKHDPGMQISQVRAIKISYDMTRVESLDRYKAAVMSSLPSPSDISERYNTSNWWWRVPGTETEYIPAISKGDQSVEKFLEAHGWKNVPSTRSRTSLVKTFGEGIEVAHEILVDKVRLACTPAFLLTILILRAMGILGS